MKSSKTFVIGDIHGAYKALVQCLEKAEFNYQLDTLICLGDVCDGWPETNYCFDELLKIKNLIYIIGNHDDWTLSWAETGVKEKDWIKQGAQSTIDSYPDGMPDNHVNLLKTAYLYYIDKNRLFVHAGFLYNRDIKIQDKNIFIWDRSLFETVMKFKNLNLLDAKLTDFDEIYIGHTPTHKYNIKQPVKSCEVWMMDTGAGWSGVLSLMNIETKEYYISDCVVDLYPYEKGRF